jgi:ketosteroid isomerase-like protein
MSMVEQLQEAAHALGRGDPEPFVSLMAEDAEWRGIPRGHLWWKDTPS